SLVYACTVVMKPCWMPKLSRRTLAIGATQLVVHEALETMWCSAGSYLSSLTPMTRVMSSPLAGAEMTTFLAPASMCFLAYSALVKRPVDSMTTSTFRSDQGSWAGSRWARTLTVLSPTRMKSSPTSRSPSRVPRTVSYLSRCASVLVSVRSLTATISMSLPPAATARQKLRPIRPKPLTPTRMVTESNSSHIAHHCRPRRSLDEWVAHKGQRATLSSMNAYRVYTKSLGHVRRSTDGKPRPVRARTPDPSLWFRAHTGTPSQRGLYHFPKLSWCFRS